jgi:DNA-binding NarL/FixJ family response regulator
MLYLPSGDYELSLHNQICMVNDEKLVVLIVDDSVLIMEKMIGILQDIENIRIVFQANGYGEAVRIIEEAEPDIVIMDIFLRGKIGMDLLQFLQKKYPSIKIAVITNHAGPHYRELCKRFGAHHFFDKSNDFDMIPKMIGGNN